MEDIMKKKWSEVELPFLVFVELMCTLVGTCNTLPNTTEIPHLLCFSLPDNPDRTLFVYPGYEMNKIELNPVLGPAKQNKKTKASNSIPGLGVDIYLEWAIGRVISPDAIR
ncbi:hypothetical protein CDAR_574871 [Caerostris darwini]|uniref:Uncharacterized protein n=1 Tax=Caerostris darwini TaxID=1538125 RepID=A0AAV4SZX0_9ARAC|nr:hypothetical protein CDAR_574871 [Caerostris darwini]